MAKRRSPSSRDDSPFLLRLQLVRERIADERVHPFTIPAVAAIDGFELHPRVTYLVGENGSGKSTILEGIAVAWRVFHRARAAPLRGRRALPAR